MSHEKACCICQRRFRPHPRLKQRQKTCAAEACRQELKRRLNQQWRADNPDYFTGRYEITIKEWYEKHPEYKKAYRQQNPEYTDRNVEYVKAHRRRLNSNNGEGN